VDDCLSSFDTMTSSTSLGKVRRGVFEVSISRVAVRYQTLVSGTIFYRTHLVRLLLWLPFL